jgi:hypothetical protein
VTDVSRLPAEAEHQELNGHVQETRDKVEGTVTTHDTFQCADGRSDYCEHSAL